VKHDFCCNVTMSAGGQNVGGGICDCGRNKLRPDLAARLERELARADAGGDFSYGEIEAILTEWARNLETAERERDTARDMVKVLYLRSDFYNEAAARCLGITAPEREKAAHEKALYEKAASRGFL
jgi:hypothetical protein